MKYFASLLFITQEWERKEGCTGPDVRAWSLMFEQAEGSVLVVQDVGCGRKGFSTEELLVGTVCLLPPGKKGLGVG